MEEARNDSSLAVGHGYEQKEVILEAHRDKKKVNFASLMTMSHQKRGVRTQFTEVQTQRRAPGGHCKRRL